MYSRFDRLHFERIGRVMVMTIDRPDRLNAVDAQMHGQLAEVWPVLDSDPSLSVVVIRGRGTHFSAGGDLGMIEAMIADASTRERVMEEARALVHNMVNSSIPVVSAIEGHAVGAGLAAALLADISIAARDAQLCDGHTRLGVAAGDHAAVIWPLLCGMAKAKYYLLTCERISGEEAERIGLVTACVEPGSAFQRAMDIAGRLADGSTQAQRDTKTSMNGWLRQALPIFDHSLELEMRGFASPEASAGLAAIRTKSPARFPSTLLRDE